MNDLLDRPETDELAYRVEPLPTLQELISQEVAKNQQAADRAAVASYRVWADRHPDFLKLPLGPIPKHGAIDLGRRAVIHTQFDRDFVQPPAEETKQSDIDPTTWLEPLDFEVHDLSTVMVLGAGAVTRAMFDLAR